MKPTSRRQFLQTTLGGIATSAVSLSSLRAQMPGARPPQSNRVEVLNPRNRVPVSLIIDDSTCLVNMAHFGIPQFAEAFPDRYKQDWRKLPREIPDAFVRKFGEWCAEQGVKGKYSVVPYPACVGWLDRELPGWSNRELRESLDLIRTLLSPNWDFHPEMISHTYAIDTRTGRPYPQRTEAFMENWGFSAGKSVDQLADYLSYALRILKNAGIPCEGITTPGGFGNRVLPELAQATLQSCRDVFNAEIPHYFRHLFDQGNESVAPRVEYASGLDTSDPKCVVSIIGCTGDWFGGWDGLEAGSLNRFINSELEHGRLVDVIQRGEPAILVCHWPGVYCNGQETGFHIFKTVVERLHAKYDHLIWMKLSEIARYWAARELTRIEQTGNQVRFEAPYACPQFTVKIPQSNGGSPAFSKANEQPVLLKEANQSRSLQSGEWVREKDRLLICFDLPKGSSHLDV